MGKGTDTSAPATTISVTEAARSFSDVVNRARYRRERFVLTKGGAPVAEIRPFVGAGGVPASEVAALLGRLPSLGRKEAERLEMDLESAREELAPAEPPSWE